MSQRVVGNREWMLRPAEHDALARTLSAEQREWLARMADVLPPGWVVQGMATPPRGGVVCDSAYPTGLRLVVAPSGPGSASMGWRPTRPSPTVGVLR